ncbi:hypothetical protein D5S17_12575 [Pseudonocardiaceae bacterium YIM PH 21723]|nr:hypothetical protein D5S17_12575 [Pseudonocardiaceae bacterium YIM PH 21723]
MSPVTRSVTVGRSRAWPLLIQSVNDPATPYPGGQVMADRMHARPVSSSAAPPAPAGPPR